MTKKKEIIIETPLDFRKKVTAHEVSDALNKAWEKEFGKKVYDYRSCKLVDVDENTDNGNSK